MGKLFPFINIIVFAAALPASASPAVGYAFPLPEKMAGNADFDQLFYQAG